MTRGQRRRNEHGARQQAPILVVTGLTREAECLRGEGIVPLCSGADAALLRAALSEKDPTQYSSVVSFGLAGGLDPILRPGDAIVATWAIGDTETREQLTPTLSRILLEGFSGAGIAARHGAVFGVDAPVMTVAEKSLLRERSGAVAVDMESHLAGAFARLNGLPFAIVRVIGDPASRALPPLAAKAIRPDGGVDVALVMRELARQPAQLGDLIRAGLDARAAFSTLRRCGGLLGPLLGLALA